MAEVLSQPAAGAGFRNGKIKYQDVWWAGPEAGHGWRVWDNKLQPHPHNVKGCFYFKQITNATSHLKSFLQRALAAPAG